MQVRYEKDNKERIPFEHYLEEFAAIDPKEAAARLGLPNGAYVRKDDLLAYGRTDVTFYKIDEEQYYMDFSVEGK